MSNMEFKLHSNMYTHFTENNEGKVVDFRLYCYTLNTEIKECCKLDRQFPYYGGYKWGT